MSSLSIPFNNLTSRCPVLSIGGNLEFSIRVPLPEVQRDDDTLYVTKPGDRLTKLAFTYYGDVTLWWVIYDTNASQFLGHPLDMPLGITIRIPSQQAVETELLNATSI